MSQELLVLHENEDMIDIIDAFCDKGVRRAPVIDKNNQICGIIAADDLLSVIADELSGVADLVKLQSSTQENVSEKEKQTKLSGIIHDRSQLGDRAQTGGRRIWGQVGDRYNVHPDDASAGPQSNAKLDIRAPQLPIENIDSNVHDQPPKVDTAKDLNITNIGGTKKNSSKK